MIKIFGIKITKIALKILIAALSASIAAAAFAVIMAINGYELFDFMAKISIRVAVIGVIAAATYDLIKRNGDD